MNWVRELTGVALLAMAGVVIIGPVEWWARRARPGPETTRKVLHTAGIVPCLFAPLLIESIWVALVLALALAAVLGIGARFGILGSVSRIARESNGEVYYPIAVFVVFLLAGDRFWMYLSALLALGVADSFAALIGSTCGRFRYRVEDNCKSLEGSLVFFAITFLAVVLPLLLMAQLPWPQGLLAALLTALLVTGFEAISLRGFDNLFVPVGVCVVLDRIVDATWQELLVKNLGLLGLLAGVGFLSRLTRQISSSATIVFVLFTYAAAVLAHWHWALVPVTGLTLYLAVRTVLPPPPNHRTRVRVVVFLHVLIPAFILLTIANAFGMHRILQGPYVACLGATMTFALRVYLSRHGAFPPRIHPVLAALFGIAIGTAVAAPSWILQQAPFPGLAAVSAVCALLAVAHEFTLPRDGRITEKDFWTASRYLLSCAAALSLAALQWWDVIPSWPDGQIACSSPLSFG